MFECPKCKRIYDKEVRNDCPSCGFKVIEVSFTAEIKVDVRIQYKGKSNMKINKRPSFEFKGGQEFRYSSNKYVDRSYRIDREKNRYTETIRDRETGELLINKDEPLKSHTDRGTAQKKEDGNR